MASIRILRLQKELKKIITTVFLTKIRDERLAWLSIREINLSSDMKYAKVYYNYTNQHIPEKVMQELVTKTSGIIKKEIASHKMMRVIPELNFILDETTSKVDRLTEIFNKIKEKDNEN